MIDFSLFGVRIIIMSNKINLNPPMELMFNGSLIQEPNKLKLSDEAQGLIEKIDVHNTGERLRIARIYGFEEVNINEG